MNVVTRKHLIDAEGQFPDATKELRACYKIACTARGRTFLEVRQVFNDADAVDQYVVFNIRGNRYRLVTIIPYSGTGARRKGICTSAPS
jgi:mRNA interferase HigB